MRPRAAILAAMLIAAAAAPTAHAAPVSAHAMVHTCCTPQPMKERIFSEAKATGAGFIRVDIEMAGIFEGPDASAREEPDWSGVDGILELSRRHDLPVLGILLVPAWFAGKDDPEEFGRLAGEIAAYTRGEIDHWEVLNQPDAEWAFDGTPEEYALMLSAAYDEIHARAPDARVVMGGIQRPHETQWLDRVFATPGADAARKFDIANIHLRGPVEPVVRRYQEVRWRLAGLGFQGPVWLTEHGYAADPAFQTDPEFVGGDAAQAAYLTQSLVGLGEVGAEQVFVTLRDNLEGAYATEGLTHIAEEPGYESTRRESFAAVRRVADQWDQLMAWRGEQRANEHLRTMHLASAALSAAEARIARWRLQVARNAVAAAREAVATHAKRVARRERVSRAKRRAEDRQGTRGAKNTPKQRGAHDATRGAGVRRSRAQVTRARLVKRVGRARTVVAQRRGEHRWHSGYARLQRERADQRALAVEALKRQIAGEAAAG